MGPLLCHFRVGRIETAMAVVVELHNTGHVANQAEIVASIEHVLHDEPGDWRVSILGSHDNDDWEMKVEGPQGFERMYTLAGGAGDHQPEAIRSVLLKLLAGRPKTV
jgi:hypothetical protein